MIKLKATATTRYMRVIKIAGSVRDGFFPVCASVAVFKLPLVTVSHVSVCVLYAHPLGHALAESRSVNVHRPPPCLPGTLATLYRWRCWSPMHRDLAASKCSIYAFDVGACRIVARPCHLALSPARRARLRRPHELPSSGTLHAKELADQQVQCRAVAAALNAHAPLARHKRRRC